ncbi:PH domain-containing protein [Halopiger thermotolerans]
MVSLRRHVPDPDDVGEPDIGFQAGFGFYLGIVATGIAAIGGLLAGATTATLLGILPSALTAVAVVGHILAKRARGLPERIGASRWRRLASYLPAAGFGAVPVGLEVVPGLEGSTALAVAGGAFALLTGVSAFGLNRLSRKRYADAVADDEPAARWTWQRSGFVSGETATIALTAVTFVGGLVLAWTGYWIGLFWAVYGIAILLAERTEWGGLDGVDPNEQWNPPEIRAHDAGLVIGDRTFIPWERIDDVRLTDDELVLERDGAWFDIRCDRSAIDDPEAVLAGIERARAGTDAPEHDRPDLRERDAADRDGGPEKGTEIETPDIETETETT